MFVFSCVGGSGYKNSPLGSFATCFWRRRSSRFDPFKYSGRVNLETKKSLCRIFNSVYFYKIAALQSANRVETKHEQSPICPTCRAHFPAPFCKVCVALSANILDGSPSAVLPSMVCLFATIVNPIETHTGRSDSRAHQKAQPQLLQSCQNQLCSCCQGLYLSLCYFVPPVLLRIAPGA